MRIINANQVGIIALGYQSENDRTQILFDISDVREEFPGGLASVAVRRPGDAEGYLVADILQDEDLVTWTVGDYDLEKRGNGEIQLIYSVSGIVAKTKIWPCTIDRSITTTQSVPPDWMDVVNTLLEAAGEVHQVTEQMETWRNETEAFRNEAGEFADTSEQLKNQTQVLHDEAESYRDQTAEMAEAVEQNKDLVQDLHDETEGYRDQVLASAETVAQDKAQVKVWRDETEHFRDSAEQIAATAGYMEVEIVNGHLIYRRTKNVDIDFALRDGHLYMEVV